MLLLCVWVQLFWGLVASSTCPMCDARVVVRRSAQLPVLFMNVEEALNGAQLPLQLVTCVCVGRAVLHPLHTGRSAGTRPTWRTIVSAARRAVL